MGAAGGSHPQATSDAKKRQQQPQSKHKQRDKEQHDAGEQQQDEEPHGVEAKLESIPQEEVTPALDLASTRSESTSSTVRGSPSHEPAEQ